MTHASSEEVKQTTDSPVEFTQININSLTELLLTPRLPVVLRKTVPNKTAFSSADLRGLVGDTLSVTRNQSFFGAILERSRAIWPMARHRGLGLVALAPTLTIVEADARRRLDNPDDLKIHIDYRSELGSHYSRFDSNPHTDGSIGLKYIVSDRNPTEFVTNAIKVETNVDTLDLEHGRDRDIFKYEIARACQELIDQEMLETFAAESYQIVLYDETLVHRAAPDQDDRIRNMLRVMVSAVQQ